MKQLVKRNLRLYFRDRMTVFFSLLSVLIVLALYFFFLGDTMVGDMKDTPGVKFLMDSWIMAGMLSITGVTTTLAAFGVVVDDNARKISRDFYTSPLSRAQLAGGYIVSSFLIGVIMSLFTFVLAETYIMVRGGELLPPLSMLKVAGVLLLSVLASSAITFLLISFFRSQNAFSVVSTIVGTIIGFLTGIYIPIGVLSGGIRLLIKLFPISHSASLLRSIMTERPIAQSFAGAPASAADSFRETMGIVYRFGTAEVTPAQSLLILVATAAVCYGAGVLVIRRKKF